MKKLIFLFAVLPILFAYEASAGKYSDAAVIMELAPSGNNSAAGSMAGARFSANTVEEIGCRVLGLANTGFVQVQCQATDAANNSLVCTSTAPEILAAAQAASAYAWFRFEVDPAGQCASLIVSTKSFHLPDSGNAKGK
jgi:hypothetical protein